MPDGKERERSVSGDFDDSDIGSPTGDGTNHPGKPGRKKNPNSQAARRDQNRIAQREFRLRKQQRIRDLEARVEILSGGKDEALGEMRNMLKDLMAENQTLRNLLRSLAGFIGEGAGGLLPKLGWDLTEFNNFVNKSETDTAWEGYQRRKKNQSTDSVPSHGQKRAADDDTSGISSKKQKNSEDGERGQNSFPMLTPMNPSPISAHTMFKPSSRPGDPNGMFTELIRGTNGGSPLFAQPSSGTVPSPQYGSVTSNLEGYQPSYMPGVNLNVESSLPSHPFETSNPTSVPVQSSRLQTNNLTGNEEEEDDDDPNKVEAYKLIRYHLDNFKRNSAYCLPSSLRPSFIQKTVPHESVIDHVLHPELRDRMILLRSRYNLVDCLLDYRRTVTIHGDDVLAHGNWEISETFLQKYGFLIDQPTLNISNRWRRERGEPEMRLSDFAGADNPPAAV